MPSLTRIFYGLAIVALMIVGLAVFGAIDAVNTDPAMGPAAAVLAILFFAFPASILSVGFAAAGFVLSKRATPSAQS